MVIGKNKRGISAVVATVLIILITVAAVTVIWAAIIPMINNQLDKGKVCFDAISQVSLPDQGYTCITSDGQNASIQIRHGPKDFELVDVQVILSAGGNSYSFDLSNDATTIVPAGAVTFPRLNEEKVYVIDTSSITGTVEKVEIAPVVRTGQSEEVCDISSSKRIIVC